MYMSNWKSNNPKQYDTNCATPEITILLGYDWFVSLKVVSSSTVETSKISSWTSSTKMASYPRRMGTSLTQQWKYRNSHRLTCWLQYALLWFFWQLFNQEHKYPSYICFAWIQERLITYIPRITQGLQKKKKRTAVQGMFIKQQYFMNPLPFLTVHTTLQAWAMLAPTRNRADIESGKEWGSPNPGWMTSKHLTAASITSSVEKCLRLSTSSSISL